MPGAVHADEYRSIISRLADARLAAGITQAELAARIGKPQSFISKIERCERRLDIWEFCRIAVSLDREPADLLRQIVPD